MSMIVETDDWGPGPNILAEEVRARLASALEETPVIVEHWFYRGARAPDRFVFDDWDDLREYLASSTRPGDKIWAWRFDESCPHTKWLAHGKVPDERGRVPMGGAY